MKRFMITALAATLPYGVEYNERGSNRTGYREWHQSPSCSPLPRAGLGNG